MRPVFSLLAVATLIANGCSAETSRPTPADHPGNPDATGPMTSETGNTGAARPATRVAATYACPMHPDVMSGRPGTCPKCGMTLVKKEGAE